MRILILLSLVLGFSFSAQALTLKEKQKLEYYKKQLTDPSGDNYLKTFKEKCGYDLPVTFDEKMITPFLAENTSVSAYCDAPRSSLSGMCDDATAKDAIKGKIKKVSCKLGKKEEKAIKLVNGDLQFTVGLGAGNLDEFIRTWAENNL